MNSPKKVATVTGNHQFKIPAQEHGALVVVDDCVFCVRKRCIAVFAALGCVVGLAMVGINVGI